MRAFVLDMHKNPLMPCHQARARKLLKSKKAKVFRMFPFTIILQQETTNQVQKVEIKIDPGSKTTGVALVSNQKVIWACNLSHRGSLIKKALLQRRQVRRSRRFRKTRYRQARFLNRKRISEWLPPSLMSRVDNVSTWVQKLNSLVRLTSACIETVRFDTQKMQNPEISGIEYQQGELVGYEVREYLLEKFNRKCVYCGAENIPLEIEHLHPRSLGGSDKISNLALACHKCNQKKSNTPLELFVKDKTNLAKIKATAKAPLADTAAVNATRYAIGRAVKEIILDTSFWSGGRTKCNRTKQNYQKDHWIDAACVGTTGENIWLDPNDNILLVQAAGRGNRQKCLVNKFGFPCSKPRTIKRVFDFSSGDICRLDKSKGKDAGRYVGKISVRVRGDFDIQVPKEKNKTGKVGANWQFFKLVQRADGFAYQMAGTTARAATT